MKNVLRVLTTALLAMVLLTACDTPEPTTAPTVPTTATPTTTQAPHTCDWGEWMMDGEYHWKGCSICGEKYRYARHDLDEKNKCADCKVKVTVDDQQHTLLTLQETYRRYPDWEKAYDADGRLYYEATYTLDNKTQLFTIEIYTYNADGSWEHILCDDNGGPTKRVLYDSNGNVTDTYTYENKYWSDGLPSHIICSRNDVLLYEERYTHVSSNRDPDYVYLSTRTDYRSDGSYAVAKYDDDGFLTDYKCYHADGSEVNNTGRFDAEMAAPLVGSWAVMVQSDINTMGLNVYGDMENRPIHVLVTYTFREDGTLLITQDLDPTQHYQYRYDLEMREWAEFNFGEYATMEEKDAACRERFGVGLHDWVTHRLLGFRFEMEGHKEQEAIYFVDKEDGLLYIADTWATFPRSGAFVIANNTLTVNFPEDALSMSMTCLTPPMPDYSHRFAAENCSALYGTWTGTMNLDAELLGLGSAERSITATVTVSFDDKGNMTMTIAMDPKEYRDFAVQVSMDLLLQQFSHLTRQQLEDLYQRTYCMTMEEFTALQVDRKNPEANAVQTWAGVYFVENGQLYSADPQNPEAESSSFTLEGDKLTMTDPEIGMVLELTKAEDAEE